MESSQVRGLRDHLHAARDLDASRQGELRDLARQLNNRSVMPVMGAGVSYDCGMRLARDLAKDMRDDYLADATFDPHAVDLLPDVNPQPELGKVADAIYQQRQSQLQVVEAAGLVDSALWPPAREIDSHFCAYRVLARLAREGLFEQAFTFNYDCGHEAGLEAEGFLCSPSTLPGRQWRDHATVIADASMNDDTSHHGALVIRKAHGCAERFRAQRERDPGSRPEDAIVIRGSQLRDWCDDLWAREAFLDLARHHVLLLLGFSGQDPAINSTITTVLRSVYSTTAPTGTPRVVVIDHQPETVELRALRQAGVGQANATNGIVTHVSTAGTTTTAVVLVLLTEILTLRLSEALESHMVSLSPQLDHRLAAFTLAGPSMLRWSYLLKRPDPHPEFVQRINLLQSAESGYVPLTHNLDQTSMTMKTRARLRTEFGHTDPETTDEALQADGFIVTAGGAFLPVGLGRTELLNASRSGFLEQARHVLPWPSDLECVLVCEESGGRYGISIATGKEVLVP